MMHFSWDIQRDICIHLCHVASSVLFDWMCTDLKIVDAFDIFWPKIHQAVSEENSMTLDDAWDAIEAPIWVPEVRVAAQAEADSGWAIWF